MTCFGNRCGHSGLPLWGGRRLVPGQGQRLATLDVLLLIPGLRDQLPLAVSWEPSERDGSRVT